MAIPHTHTLHNIVASTSHIVPSHHRVLINKMEVIRTKRYRIYVCDVDYNISGVPTHAFAYRTVSNHIIFDAINFEKVI